MSASNTRPPFNHDIPEPVHRLILQFFALADSNTESAPSEIASLFTENGEMHSIAGLLTGRGAIREGRQKSWVGISSRRHSVLELYFQAEREYSILLVGTIDAKLKNGKSLETEFVGKFVIVNGTTSHPQILSYKSWADSAPWIKALAG